MSLETNKSAKNLGEVSWSFIINPIQDGHFRDCRLMRERGRKPQSAPRIFHIYPTMMKLGKYVP